MYRHSQYQPTTPPYPIRLLHAVGGTVRLDEGRSDSGELPLPRVLGVLVVGPCPLSHFWLSILPLATDASMRCFIRAADVAAISEYLYVQPGTTPAFMVMVDGYFVDSFPAPLPSEERAADPMALVREVRERLRTYA